MRYAQTGIRGYVPPGGACAGHRYEDRPHRADPHMSVDCPRCEPWLAKDPLWSSSPVTVPLNGLEQKAAGEETAKREHAVLQNAADSAAAIGNITQILQGLVATVNGLQGPQAPAVPAAAPVPAVAVPEAAAPAAGTAAPKAKAPRSRAKAAAGAGA